MASKTSNRSHPLNFNLTPSPDTMFLFPVSPGEPGKFDFYRVHLANHASYPDSMFSDNSNAPILTTSTSTSTTRRWTPFADVPPSEQSKSSIFMNSTSSNSIPTSKSQTISSNNSNLTLNTTNSQIQSTGSFSSLTDVVKNAMHIGHLSTSSNQIRRPSSGTTLSTKDLNHLSPQSM